MQDWRYRGPKFKSGLGQKEKFSQVQSEKYHHQSLCPRVLYLKLSEVKAIKCFGTVVECSSRDPEVSSLNASVVKKKDFNRSNHNNPFMNPSAPELNTLDCKR